MGIFRWLLRSIFLSMIRPPQNDLSHTSRDGDDSPSFVGKSFFPDNHDRLCIPFDDVRKSCAGVEALRQFLFCLAGAGAADGECKMGEQEYDRDGRIMPCEHKKHLAADVRHYVDFFRLFCQSANECGHYR